MKTFKRILLIIFILILVLIAALAIWQRDNITSFVNSLKYSEKELSQKLEDNNKKMDEIVEKTEYIDVKKGGLTPEEEKAVTSGEISEEDAIKIIRGQSSLEEIKTQNQEEKQKQESEPDLEQTPQVKEEQASKPPQVEQPPQEKPVEEKPAEETMTDEASNIVAELYVVKANFISQLESTGQQMYNEYIATHYDPTQIMPIVDKYMPIVSQMESQCDSTINGLLARLEEVLKNGGGDLGLVDEIRRYYYKEKSLKKSYYLNLIYENSK